MRKRTERMVLAAFVCALLAGCAHPLDKGIKALSREAWQDARQHADAGLKQDRQDPGLHYVMASALVGEGQFKRARPHARKAYEAGWRMPDSARLLGRIHWELGQPVEAVDAWRAARAVDPTSVTDEVWLGAMEAALAASENQQDLARLLALREELAAWRPEHPEAAPEKFQATREQLAKDLVQRGELGQAAAMLEALVTARPEAVDQAFELGELYVQLEREEDARGAWQRHVERTPLAKRAHRASKVAERAETLGQLLLAVHFFEEAIRLGGANPNFARARNRLGLAGVQMALGREPIAREHMEAYLAEMSAIRNNTRDPETYITAANLATQRQNTDLAVELLERAMVEASPSWRAAQMLADMYARRARPQEVERVLEAHVARAGDGLEAELQAGRWALGRKNLELARHYLEKAAARPSDRKAPIQLELVRVYGAMHAQDLLKTGVDGYLRLAPEDSAGHMECANLFMAERMFAEAEALLKRAFRADRENLAKLDRLMDLYVEWGRPQEFAGVAREWIEARGKNPADMQLIGERHMRRNQWDEALAYLQDAARLGQLEAWLMMADIHRRQRRDQAMRHVLESYLAQAPKRHNALRRVLGYYRGNSSLNLETARILEELIRVEPHDWSHYEQLSEIYMSQRREADAMRLMQTYVARASQPMEALRSVARRLEQRGAQRWLLALFAQYENGENPDPRIYRLLGDTYMGLSDGAEARAQASQLGLDAREVKARAHAYYDKYLTLARPGYGEAREFGDHLRQRRAYEVAARAYALAQEQGAPQDNMLAHHAEVLLNLGQVERAAELLSTLHESQNKSLPTARQSAQLLMQFKQYRRAEPYLRQIFENGDHDMVQEGFTRLFELYRASDRHEKLPALVSQYLERAQNPTQGRQLAMNLMEGAGFWQMALNLLERQPDRERSEYFMERARFLMRDGREDEARAEFERAAQRSKEAPQTWMEIARFYSGRAMSADALRAVDRALGLAPMLTEGLLLRAELSILRGDVEGGVSDYERARQGKTPQEQGEIWAQQIGALRTAGRFDLVEEAEEAALGLSGSHRSQVAMNALSEHLRSGDPVQVRGALERARSEMAPAALVEALYSGRMYQLVTQTVESESADGDHATAGQWLVEFADAFTREGGMERLLRAARPLMAFEKDDGRTQGRIGEFLAREGHLRDALPLLQAAVNRGHEEYRLVLAHAHLTLGHHDEALTHFQDYLAGVRPELLEPELRGVAMRFEQAQSANQLALLLQHLMFDSRLAPQAASALFGQWLDETGDPQRVLERLAPSRLGLASSPSPFAGETPEAGMRQAWALMGAGLEQLAARGYMAEVDSYLLQLPDELRHQAGLKPLMRRLSVARAARDPEERRATMAQLGEGADDEERLELARQLTVFGLDAEARQLLEPLVRSPRAELATRAAGQLLGVLRASGQDDAVEAAVSGFLDSREDREMARTTMVGELLRLGYDDLAARLAAQGLAKTPNETQVHQVLGAAVATGDVKLTAEAAQAMWRVSDSPLAHASQRYLKTLLPRVEPGLLEPLMGPLREARPQELELIWMDVAVKYRTGRVAQAREQLLEYLQWAQFHPRSVRWAALELVDARLYGEAARFLGPLVEERVQHPSTLWALALSNVALGRLDDARRQLDLALERQSEPWHWATLFAEKLHARGYHELALEYARRAMEMRPDLPHARVQAGLALMAMGRREEALPLLDSSLQEGVGRLFGLHRSARAALDGGHPDLAERFLLEMLQTPMLLNHQYLVPFRLALATFDGKRHARQGVAFFEKHYPRLTKGTGIAGMELNGFLSGLYERAGLAEPAGALYDHAIAQVRLAEPNASNAANLATYMNNLAYTYSTTNRQIEKGLDLVRRAIAGSESRTPSYIDTLGWLLYRQGDLAGAETQIRRALRTSTGSEAELVELYEHLAHLAEAQGRHEEAVWLGIYVTTLDEDRE